MNHFSKYLVAKNVNTSKLQDGTSRINNEQDKFIFRVEKICFDCHATLCALH